ncbi:MAG: hypothetical protein OEZ43_05540 [Gammaproteobacteria bacterium]|nr:hypothetical protein [Gammaproteobacteria bacterium]
MNKASNSTILDVCPLVRSDQLDLLTEIGLDAFGEQGPRRYGLSRKDYYQRLFGLNNRIFRFILRRANEPVVKENIAGLISVIPTRKPVYNAFRYGQISQFEFDEHHIHSEFCATTMDLYLQTLYLGDERFSMVRRMFLALMESISEALWLNEGAGSQRDITLFGEGVSQEGRRLMQSFNMEIAGTSREQNPVFAIQHSKDHPLQITTPHSKINASFQKVIGRIAA